MVSWYRDVPHIRTVLFFLLTFFGTYLSAAPTNTITADKQVCTDTDSNGRCSVNVEWSGNSSGSGAPYCVFIKSSKTLWACSPKSGRATYTYVPMSSTVLELRAGSNSYDSSTLVDSVVLTGLESRATTNQKSIEKINSSYLKKFQYSFSGSTWDGKLYFEPRYFTTTPLAPFTTDVQRYGLAVKVLRDKNLKKDSSGKINFGYDQAQDSSQGCTNSIDLDYISDNECINPEQDKRIFSDGYLIDSPNLTAAQIAAIPHNRIKDIKNFYSRVGNNQLGVDSPIYTAAFPHPSIKNNPYRANLNGNPSDTDNYVAYRLYVVTASYKMGNIVSKYPEFATNTPYYFLGKFELIIVVKDPDTNHSSVANVRILSPAQPLYDTSGSLLYGYEMGVSLDGQLMTYSGNPEAGSKPGRGGRVMYTYTPNAFLNNAWSVPKNISAMYDADGPGRPGGETFVNNVPFSKRFPIAKYPIRDFRGNRFTAETPIMGAYTWLGFDASEAAFSTVANFYGPARQGTVMVGRRTHGVIYHMDGDMNLTRGNPTDKYSIYNKGVTQQEYLDIAKAYQELKAPNFNDDVLGKSGAEQVTLVPVGLYGTSWSPFAKETNPILPLDTSKRSYGFILSNTRYAEVKLLDNMDDLLLYYPMNEPVLMDPAIINSFLDGGVSTEEVRKNGVKFITNQTADYSDHLQYGTLVGGAYYPFEFNKVKEQWANNKILKDIQEGAYGNSIYFEKNGSVQTNISNELYKKIVDSGEFNISFWLKNNSSTSGSVFSLQNFLSVWVNAGNIDLTFYNQLYPSGIRVVTGNIVKADQWNNISIDYKLGWLKIHLNGELVKTTGINGNLLASSNFQNGLKLFLGPNGSLNGSSYIQMDEVYFHSSSLTQNEVVNLMGDKFLAKDKSAIESPEFLTGLSQEYVSIPKDQESKIRQLGHDLFNSKELSSNRSKSCSSCHKPALSFSDNTRFSAGVNGISSRNTPSLVNLLYMDYFFFDGRAESIEEQVLHPILDSTEMGFTDLSSLMNRLSSIPKFKSDFLAAFGRNPNQTDMAVALARYVRGLETQSTTFDSGLLSASAQKGMEIFYGYGNCVACHSGPNFTDGKFHNVGISLDSADLLENGRSRISKRYSDIGGIKTPSLRNVSLTAPYFHDGRFATLLDVVDHYSSGGDGGKYQSDDIRPLLLNADQKQSLVDFLNSLHSGVSEN